MEQSSHFSYSYKKFFKEKDSVNGGEICFKEKDAEYFDAKNLRLDQALKIASLAILVNKAPFIREKHVILHSHHVFLHAF